MPNINQSYAWAIATCDDPDVRYSMDYDKRAGVTIDGLTYYDCSSFIWFALVAGGFDCTAANGGNSYPFATGGMRTVLLALGFVEVSRTGTILPGDIGVHNRGLAGGHTEMYYTGGAGTGRTMGAHSSGYAPDAQVAINSGNTVGTYWDALYRYGNGVNYSWHNKNTGAYSRESVEAQENVLKIMSVLMSRGWTSNAVAGLVGNIEAESGLNPWRWQDDRVNMSMGYGLFQYTPANKYVGDSRASQINEYAPNYPMGSGGQDDGTAQLLYMLQNSVPDGQGGRGTQYIPTAAYPETLAEFAASTQSPEYLASAWLKNFERASVEVEAQRRANAAYWFEWINNHGYIPASTSSDVIIYKRHLLNRKRVKKS